MTDETLFHQARERPAGDRAAFLDQACGPDAALRRRIELLLDAHDSPGNFMARPLVDAPATLDLDARAKACSGQPGSADAEPVGRMIGRYKLLQPIGEGGFGTVYMAEQQEPVRRKVAVKIIKLGMDTKQVIARFEAERQALAMMDHPNIAKVLDAGATDTGRPYFVMELVRGVPITEYCNANHLDTPQRLALFVQVCQAVQHAHAKGIIHRDLKPSNVLVTMNDDKPIPKVIDFGIAKAIHQRLTERTLFTEFRQMIGTPQYMSPEQAQLSALDIDTRSDVYSLGVLLYELLTGTTPIDARELRSAAYDQMQKMIREFEPPTPSTRLSTMGELLATVAADRRTEPRKLSRLMKGELDWIVMKALEKDRTRRYDTASGMARDIERYLADDTVEACPPSAWYRFRKFVRRNKGSLGTTATLTLVTLLLLSVSLWVVAGQRDTAQRQKVRAQGAETRALADRDLARQAEREKSEQLWQAQFARAQALRGSGMSGRRFDGLEALTDASRLVHVLYQDDPAQLKKHLRALRNEAVECLALPDLRIARRWAGNPPGTTAVALDAPFKHYARADGRGHVSLRAVEGDGETQQLACFAGPVTALFFSPDDHFLAARSGEYLRIWDLKNGAAAWQAQGKFTEAFDFSPDSRLAAVGREDGVIVLYDLSTGEEKKALPWKQRPIRIRFHSEGQRLAVSTDKTGSDNLILLDIATGKAIEDGLPFYSNSPATAFACSPDGTMFAVGDAGGRIHFCQYGASSNPGVSHQAEILDVAYNHHGDMLASLSRDGTICLWDPQGYQPLHVFVVADVTRLQFSADDRFLGVGLSGSEIRLYEVAPGRECLSLGQGTVLGSVPTPSVHISPDGRLLAAGGDSNITFLDLATGKDCSFLPTGIYIKNADRPNCSTALFHPDGKSLLTCGSLGGIQHWPITVDPKAPGSLHIGPPINLGILPPGTGTAGRMAVTPDGHTLAASLDWGGGGRILDLEGKRDPISIPPVHGALDVAISPDAAWVAIGTYQGSGAQVYDVRSARLVRELPGGDACVAFSPDGKWLVTGTADGYRFWRTGSWEEGRRIPREMGGRTQLVSSTFQVHDYMDSVPELGVSLKDHGRQAGPLAFSADGKLLAIASSPWQVQLIDPVSGDPLASMDGPFPYLISALCFSPDGSRLAVAREAGTIQLWNLAAIHRQLVTLNLDWGLPAPHAAPEQPARQALNVELAWGDTIEARRQAVIVCRKLAADMPTWTNQRALAANLNQLGVACHDKGQVRESEQAYREALEILEAKVNPAFGTGLVDPSWPVCATNLGIVLRETGRLQEAEQALRKGISAVEASVLNDPNNASQWDRNRGNLYQALGDVLQATGNLPKAEQAFRQALEYEEKLTDLPKAAETHLRLARLLACQSQWENAAKEYVAVIELPPGEQDSDAQLAKWCEYASVLLLHRDNDGYHRVCQQVLERFGQTRPNVASYMVTRIFSLAPNKTADPQQTIKLTQDQLALFGGQGWFRHTLAVACYRADQFAPAVGQCEQSMMRDPGWRGHIVNWLLLAMAHQRLGHTQEAREWLDKAELWIELDGEDKVPPFLDDLARSVNSYPYCDWLEILLLRREAEALLKRSDARPGNLSPAVAANARGAMRQTLGQTDKAIADFSQAIELDPKFAEPWNNRGSAYGKLAQWDKAIAEYSRAIELKPDYTEAWRSRGLDRQQLGQTDKAIADLSKAIELGPKDNQPLNDLAWLLVTCADAKSRDPARAVELATRALELTPQDSEAWRTLGVAQYRAGNWKPAIEALVKSTALHATGGDALDWFFLAMAHWQLAEKDEARMWYGKSIEWMQMNEGALKKDKTHDEGLMRRVRAEAEELMKIEKDAMSK